MRANIIIQYTLSNIIVCTFTLLYTLKHYQTFSNILIILRAHISNSQELFTSHHTLQKIKLFTLPKRNSAQCNFATTASQDRSYVKSEIDELCKKQSTSCIHVVHGNANNRKIYHHLVTCSNVVISLTPSKTVNTLFNVGDSASVNGKLQKEVFLGVLVCKGTVRGEG